MNNAGIKPGRNEACPCGSGKKYKRCCGRDSFAAPPPKLLSLSEIGALVALVTLQGSASALIGPFQQAILPEDQIWHARRNQISAA